MKYTLSIFLACFSSLLISQSTEIIFLSGTDADHTVEWDFYCTEGMNSGHWTKIPVPSNWELEGFGTYNYGHDWNNKAKMLGMEHGLYKYSFEVPAKWKGKAVNIVFDGAMTDAQVKINGVSAGDTHQGAFYRFKYDISKLLKYGQTNLLEVDVAKHSANESVNKAERQADFWIFGGIFRPVFLEVHPAVHLDRAAINARADGSFNIFFSLINSGTDYKINVELFDMKGTKADQVFQTEVKKGVTENWISGKFENIHAWNPEWPVLYDMKISLLSGDKVIHEVTKRIGFRTVELRKHDGIYINDQKVVFKGVNRHSFWPETGRCLSDENQLNDILLMKDMNMNAVRMSHYVPDQRFLDLCDSLGLFVLDEVTGWQDSYDTLIGPKVIKETVLKDENQPSVVIWDHGNEGGWNFANEKWFDYWDIQDRPVICPWMLHNGIDTHHYPAYTYGLGRFMNGNDPFMPTEFLHGLYDGGLGAGLDDYWKLYQSSPLHAGGFLWVFADEAVLRTDMEGKVYDGDGNHAPDGIVGPHREKEGSYYTIKEVWSPVQVKPITINRKWDGRLFLENKFLYTNLNACSFSWKALKTYVGKTTSDVVGEGRLHAPDADPGETAGIGIDLNGVLQDADIFEFTAMDMHGHELYTWSWPLVTPEEYAGSCIENSFANNQRIILEESSNLITAKAGTIEIIFNKADGTLTELKNNKGPISFSGGRPVGTSSAFTGSDWRLNSMGDFEFRVRYDQYPKEIKWTLQKDGMLKFEAQQITNSVRDADYIGISFNYPEEKCTGIKWMGRGPFRVWKNRIKGSNIGVWEKKYNNTITGESFNNLIYPEFKGYHGNMYWLVLETSEAPITIVSETPDLFFCLYTPGKPKYVAGGTYPAFPEGDLSFLYEIPAIGTKFKKPEALGPMGQKGNYSGHKDDEYYPVKLWFDFRGKQ